MPAPQVRQLQDHGTPRQQRQRRPFRRPRRPQAQHHSRADAQPAARAQDGEMLPPAIGERRHRALGRLQPQDRSRPTMPRRENARERAAPEGVRDPGQEAPQRPASGCPHRVPVSGRSRHDQAGRCHSPSRMGDPAGIGPDITLKAWSERRDNGIGALRALRRPRGAWPSERAARPRRADHPRCHAGAALDAFGASLPIRPVPCRVRPRPGEPDAADAAAIITAIEEATAAVVRRRGRWRSSPTRSPSTRSTGADFPYPAIPSSWARWPSATVPAGAPPRHDAGGRRR